MDQPESQLIAEGTADDGASWTLSARREDEEYRGRTESALIVMMHVTAADGLRHGESGLGALLPPIPGRMMETHWGGGINELRSFCGFVHPDICRLTLTGADGGSADVPLYDCADFPEVRFAALVLPDDLRIKAVTGYSHGGEPLARKVFPVPEPGQVIGYSGTQSDQP